MDWRKRDRVILKPSRPICPHSSRPSKSFSKPGICILCVCDKIEDIIEIPKENTPPSQKILMLSLSMVNEIVHNVRLINSAMDSQMEAQVSMENVMHQVISILTELLKYPNDEICIMVAEVVKKMCTKINPSLSETLVEKIVQSQKGETLRLGVLEVFRHVLQVEMNLSLFVDKFGHIILPKMFQTLGSVSENANPRILKEFTFNGSQLSQFSQFSQSQTFFDSNNTYGGGSREDAFKTLAAVYSLIDLVLKFVGKSLDEKGLISVYLPNISQLVTNSIFYLRETLPNHVVEQSLAFLTTLCSNESTLCQVLKTRSTDLCTALKRILLCNCGSKQKSTVHLLSKIFNTYNSLSPSYKTARQVNDFPDVVAEIDLIHAISQIMATSDADLFSCILDLVNSIHIIPSLREKLGVLIESGLRVASIAMKSDYSIISTSWKFFLNVIQDLETVPYSIQQQIISVYGKLPVSSLSPKELSEWAKLLLYCKNTNFLFALNTHYAAALNSLRESPLIVSNLKLFLTLTQALCNQKQEESQSVLSTEVDEGLMLISLMQCKCIPSIMVLSSCAQSEESGYVKTLLNLMLHFPTNTLVPPKSDTPVLKDMQMFKVEYYGHSKTLSQVATFHQVEFSPSEIYANNCWNSGAFMRVLGWIRSNMELIKDKSLFDLWNQNVAIVVASRFSLYLPTLCNLWTPLSQENEEENVKFLSQVFERMDLNMGAWNRSIASVTNSQESSEKLQMEAVLVFYYFTCLFNLNDPDELMNAEFQKSFTEILKNCIEDLENSSDWNTTFTYSKIALLMTSCKYFDIYGQVEEQLQTLTYKTLNSSKISELDQIITYCEKVITKTIFLGLFPSYFYVHLMEKWYELELEEFRHFFEHCEVSIPAICSLIIEITAEAPTPCSDFMVKIVRSRVAGWESESEKRTLFNALIRLERDILADNEASNRLRNFTNLISLSMNGTGLFEESLVDTFPLVVYSDFVKVLILHYGFEKIGRNCLLFLTKCLPVMRSRSVLNLCLNNDFLALLNKIICYESLKDLKEDGYSEVCDAFEIIFMIMQAINKCGEKLEPEQHRIKWKLTSVISVMSLYELNDSVLQMVNELIRKDFKSQLVHIEESDPIAISDILLTMQFYARSIIHRAFTLKSQEIVWEFYLEILNFSGRSEGKHLAQYRLEFDPWNILTFEAYIPHKDPLFMLPKMFWEFVHKWVQLISKDKKHCEIPPVSYQCFNIGSFLIHLRNRINTEVIDGIFPPLNFPLNPFADNSIELIKEKEGILREIAEICFKIMSPTFDLDSKISSSTTTEAVDKSVAPQAAALDSSVEIIQVLPVCIEISDSDTCSESELNLAN